MSKIETLDSLIQKCSDVIDETSGIADEANDAENAANTAYNKATDSITEIEIIKESLQTLKVDIEKNGNVSDETLVYYEAYTGNGNNPIAFEFDTGWKGFVKSLPEPQRQYVTVYRVCIKLTPSNAIALFNTGACHLINCPDGNGIPSREMIEYKDLQNEVDGYIDGIAEIS